MKLTMYEKVMAYTMTWAEEAVEKYPYQSHGQGNNVLEISHEIPLDNFLDVLILDETI